MNSNVGTSQIESPASQPAKSSPQAALLEKLAPLLEAQGYELVHLEMQMHHGKVLRLYIDRAEGREIDRAGANLGAIGVEDCAIVSRALDEPLEAMPEVDKAFGGAYELEVSSPGVDRPLRKIRDFEKFAGRDARIHTFRPLTADELGNADYQKRNPKQKNFLGCLSGIVLAGPDASEETAAVKLSVAASMGKTSKAKNQPKDEILLPMRLIAKANIEPDFS